jgi:DivIVA domain-containing protein
MRRKKGTEEAPTTGEARITPEEVQQVEFRLAFRGYNERDVDAFLDRITQGMSSYLEENERLRSGTGRALAAPAASDGDADAIVTRARAEAEEIVRRAHEQAAGIRAAAEGGSGDARGAVAPFLNKEREFLQSLGSLVQTHAEEIKQMVMAIRERDAAVQADRASATADASAAEASPAFEPASAAEIRERLQATEPPVEITPPDENDSPEPQVSQQVVVESATEPVFSTEGSPAIERRERSLRELFWGED